MISHTTNPIFGNGFDAELRNYQLLALEQRARTMLKRLEIFPTLTQLSEWRNEAAEFLSLIDSFEKKLKLPLDDSEITEAYSMDVLRQRLDEMHELATLTLKKTQVLIDQFESVKHTLLQQLHSEPVGIVPLYRNDGYMILTNGNQTSVFRYHRKMIFGQHEAREIESDYYSTFSAGMEVTPLNIKINLLGSNHAIPNPATWSFYVPVELPLHGTLLPLAKEKLNVMIDG